MDLFMQGKVIIEFNIYRKNNRRS